MLGRTLGCISFRNGGKVADFKGRIAIESTNATSIKRIVNNSTQLLQRAIHVKHRVIPSVFATRAAIDAVDYRD